MEELGETCRTCLNQDEKLLPITSLIESNCRITDYFDKYLQIHISHDNNLPSNICLKCLNKLLDVRKFHLQCRDSENYLKLKLQITLKSVEATSAAIQNVNKFEDILEKISDKNSETSETHKCDSEILSNVDIIKKEELDEEYLLDIENFEADENSNGHAQEKFDEDRIKEGSENASVNSEHFVHYEILEEYVTDPNITGGDKEKQIHNCQECNENFKYLKNLQFHIKLCHDNKTLNPKNVPNIEFTLYKSTKLFKEKALTCKKCQKKFAFRTNYNIHMKRHSQNKKSSNESCVCSICGKKFDNKTKLQKHAYRHNIKYNEIPCPICNKIFKAKYHLKIHLNQHTGAKPFLCNICNKNFVSPSSLRLHKTLHEGKKIQCPMCETKLAARTQLKIHMRMHTNERPYACSQCPKRYKQLCALKVHVATHSGIKSVQCEECSACFYSKNHLLSHKIKIHRPKRFHCNKCPRQFPTPFQMKTHLLSVHKICIKDLSPYEINKIVME